MQNHENLLWNDYQNTVARLKAQFQEWFDSSAFVRSSGVDWEGFDAAVQAWYASNFEHDPPQDFTAYVNVLRDSLRTAFNERHADLLDSVKAAYEKWFAGEKEKFLSLYFDEVTLVHVFRAES